MFEERPCGVSCVVDFVDGLVDVAVFVHVEDGAQPFDPGVLDDVDGAAMIISLMLLQVMVAMFLELELFLLLASASNLHASYPYVAVETMTARYSSSFNLTGSWVSFQRLRSRLKLERGGISTPKNCRTGPKCSLARYLQP